MTFFLVQCFTYKETDKCKQQFLRVSSQLVLYGLMSTTSILAARPLWPNVYCKPVKLFAGQVLLFLYSMFIVLITPLLFVIFLIAELLCDVFCSRRNGSFIPSVLGIKTFIIANLLIRGCYWMMVYSLISLYKIWSKSTLETGIEFFFPISNTASHFWFGGKKSWSGFWEK